jgi:hypothetical protein
VKPVSDFVRDVASYFESQLGSSLVEVFQLGSLAHGGFSLIYSDIDVGILLSCATPPGEIDTRIADAKALDAEYGKKLSVFWGNPECRWGRLPVLDRLDLLDHGIPLLHNRKAEFTRPARVEIEAALLDSVEKSWKPRIGELTPIRHYFEPAKAMSPTAVGNRTLPRRPPRNPLTVMFRAVGACKQPVRSSAHRFRAHRFRSLLFAPQVLSD